MSGSKTFVGFGFGPIQSALFLYEAYRAGGFARFVVADVDRVLVRALRSSGGRYTVNIARRDGVDRAVVEGVELLDPGEACDRERIVQAVAAADEMCTALPSVAAYAPCAAGGECSPSRLLARGLSRRETPLPTILYTAENHNHAAEILSGELAGRVPAAVLASVQVLNTVIGKMSGVIADPREIERLGLATLTPQIPRAVLVEEFNRILISRVRLPGFRRGIEVFQEKDDLLPFEEAKLYGHNAIHALIAYLADWRGYLTVAEAGADPWIMQTARRAFIDESGAALIRRHAGLGDPLFTPAGWARYAADLLERMTNPHLNDRVERVGRDPLRKLGFDDRLYGAMTIALEQGVEPRSLALGAAAAMLSIVRRRSEPGNPFAGLSADALDEDHLGEQLGRLWDRSAADPARRERFAPRLIALSAAALGELQGMKG